MAFYQNFVQMIIRGLVNGQRWQITPTWAVTDVIDLVGDEEFIFTPDAISTWFSNVWNGTTAIGTARGFSDLFGALFTPEVTINEVRVLARSKNMLIPEQQIFATSLTGGRAVGAGNYSPSFLAASCFAQSDVYGKRGASLRLPGLSDLDHDGNFFDATALLRYREGILEAFDTNPSLGELQVLTGDGLLDVSAMNTVSVKRVFPTPTGEGPSGSPRQFPYEDPYPIIAVPCTDWQVHDWVSTQNSRKIGRGT